MFPSGSAKPVMELSARAGFNPSRIGMSYKKPCMILFSTSVK